GSAGLDLAVATDVILKDDKVQVVQSVLNGPLGHGLSALLLGRSSLSKQGIFVLPGVIDADYTGNIVIMIKAFCPPVTIAAGTRVAQLIPFHSVLPRSLNKDRGNQGFGSTGTPQIAFSEVITQQKPRRKVCITGQDGICLVKDMLLDTGSDVTII
ncbi:hypothetical protein N339_01362, partial [Pterocles gutturalis]